MEFPGEAAADTTSRQALAEGSILGERYRIRSHLGSGGMGDVWRALDLKLRVEVALKSVRAEMTKDTVALETLRQEVRVAREVISPNVCRVFDLQEVEDQEWISMEYVDGTTLTEILRNRGPLELDEAREIASQFLAGLEAIHEAGLVHRDIKPENLMVTRTGRVVVMDFGIAKSLEEGRDGMIAGTPAYMSPEQSHAREIDARADVFSAGVVLAEMVEPGGLQSIESRQRVWRGLHAEAPEVADTPWAGVIRKAVAPQRESRHASASVLARALEEVTLRAAGDEDARPYPGLAAFGADDAQYFFGRELEVEELWKKLRRPHLQALIAPSGAGKSSFLRAGLLATLPTEWGAVVVTPGRQPFAALSQALQIDLADDGSLLDAAGGLKDPEAVVAAASAWRGEHEHALIVIDQFEELFTQSPPEVQGGFADLIARLPLESDVHVLLAMREDFHFHCQPFESLAPVFSETTPLGALSGNALRRALVQPALKCGYRFEDDALVDEMVGEVSHERGALPLLAFAAARLWDKRDREAGRLTRAAYEEIGGVGGALGQHAEATLEKIGKDRAHLVRELFRNLVTAQGTRATRDRRELLSVFSGTPDTAGAGEVLDALIDARLLTTYEENPAEGETEGETRLEIIHESLLTNWPRLVRWRTQDAEGAQLRDDLRQTAQRWQDRGQPDDLLWSGTSYKEYELWRERYSGGLSTAEQTFARAMTAHAERRKRRRRWALGVAFAVLLAVLGVVGSFWRRAVSETQRAEAQKLLALGQLEFETDPTATLAYATQSLELADSKEGRELALEALWKAPPRWVVGPAALGALFSPDGRWLANGGMGSANQPKIRLTSAAGASRPLELVHETRGASVRAWLDADHFTTMTFKRPEGALLFEHALWSAEDGGAVALPPAIPYSPHAFCLGWDLERSRAVALTEDGEVQVAPFDGSGPFTAIGRITPAPPAAERFQWIAPDGRWIATSASDEVLVYDIDDDGLGPARTLGTHPQVTSAVAAITARHLVTRSNDGVIKVWTPFEQEPPRTVTGPAGLGYIEITPDASMVRLSTYPIDDDTGQPSKLENIWIASLESPQPSSRDLGRHWTSDSRIALDAERRQAAIALRPAGFLWARLDAPPGTVPISLQAPIASQGNAVALHPEGNWLLGSNTEISVWPLHRPYPYVLEEGLTAPRFDAQGRLIARSSNGEGNAVHIWQLEGDFPRHDVWQGPAADLDLVPGGELLIVGPSRQRMPGPIVVSLTDGSSETLPEPYVDAQAYSVSSDGRYLAGSGGQLLADENVVKVWDLETRQLVATHDPDEVLSWCCTGFTSDNDVLWASEESGLWRWNFENDETELIYEGAVGRFHLGQDSSWLIMRIMADESARLVALNLKTRKSIPLLAHGDQVRRSVISHDGRTVVSVDQDGVIRVGPITGEEPHLLIGHSGAIFSLAIDPLGRWIISSGTEGTHFWPMPDLDRTPLQALPRAELVALLQAQTNARLIADPDDPTGWVLEWQPFPGWERLPPKW